MLVVIFLIFEFGRVFGSWLIVTNAAREGARVGVVEPYNVGSDGIIVGRVQTAASFLNVGSQLGGCGTTGTTGIVICRSADSFTQPPQSMLTVTVFYQLQTVTPISISVPFLGSIGYPGTVQLVGTTTMRSETTQ
jgi:Flp pilus assembly protein TadG